MARAVVGCAEERFAERTIRGEDARGAKGVGLGAGGGVEVGCEALGEGFEAALALGRESGAAESYFVEEVGEAADRVEDLGGEEDQGLGEFQRGEVQGSED